MIGRLTQQALQMAKSVVLLVLPPMAPLWQFQSAINQKWVLLEMPFEILRVFHILIGKFALPISLSYYTTYLLSKNLIFRLFPIISIS